MHENIIIDVNYFKNMIIPNEKVHFFDKQVSVSSRNTLTLSNVCDSAHFFVITENKFTHVIYKNNIYNLCKYVYKVNLMILEIN